MERTTFCLLFYIRRTKLNRNGEAPIMMRITVNGVRVDASVKKTILPEFWSAAKGKALEKKREYKELNLYLDSRKSCKMQDSPNHHFYTVKILFH